MERDDLVAAIARERLAVADLLETLSPEQLATPSRCAGWSVHAVAAHLTMTWSVSVPSVMLGVLRNRGSIARTFDAATLDLAKRPIADITASLRAHATERKHPPRLPAAPLVDVIVHGDDMRQPLGIDHDVPAAALQAALEQLVLGRDLGAFLPRQRLAGLRLAPTDLDWSWGQGASVAGPARAVLNGILGRRDALVDLRGDGAALLAARLGG